MISPDLSALPTFSIEPGSQSGRRKTVWMSGRGDASLSIERYRSRSAMIVPGLGQNRAYLELSSKIWAATPSSSVAMQGRRHQELRIPQHRANAIVGWSEVLRGPQFCLS
ncbi:MAG: hypothetical protein ACI8W8_003288 [Rhodothermales bacterium]|jgi:hypothetical protein